MGVVKAGTANTDNGVVVTIPAGKIWVGHVQISAVMSSAVGSSATSVEAYVTVEGDNSDPDEGSTIAKVVVGTPAVNALSLIGSLGANSNATPPMTVEAPAGNVVTLVLHKPSTIAAAATAVGNIIN